MPNDVESVRFLAQSTFGATTAEVARLQRLGYSDWIEQQFRIPRTSHLDFVLAVYPIPTPDGVTVTIDPLYQTFWKQAITAPDALRQRVTYALSEIFVTSAADAASAERAAYAGVVSGHAVDPCLRQLSGSAGSGGEASGHGPVPDLAGEPR